MADLITQAEYARRRGVSRVAVHKRIKSGAIPGHGPRKMIDPAEADALWDPTMNHGQQKSGNSRHKLPEGERKKGTARKAPKTEAPGDAREAVEDALAADDPGLAEAARNAGPMAQAKVAAAIIKAKTDKINLERLQGRLIEKDKALLQAFSFTRNLREAFLNWPSRAAPTMAASLGVDQHELTALLEKEVRDFLIEYTNQQLDLG